MTLFNQSATPLFLSLFVLVGCVRGIHTADQRIITSTESGADTIMMEKNLSNQTVSYLKGDNLFLTANITDGTNEEKCRQYINQYREDFRLHNPDDELAVQSSTKDDLGYSHIKFAQRYRLLDIWMSSLSMHLNQNNQLYLVKGQYYPTPDYLDVDDAIDEEIIIIQAARNNIEISGHDFVARKMIYFANESDAILVYKLTPTSALSRSVFLVDARTAKIIVQLPMIQT